MADVSEHDVSNGERRRPAHGIVPAKERHKQKNREKTVRNAGGGWRKKKMKEKAKE